MLTDNLVSYWKLDGNSNDSVTTNNGTDTDITYGTSYGKIGQGADFNDSTSKILLPNLGVGGSSARTISFWMNSADVSTASLHSLFYYGAISDNTSCALQMGVATGSIYWYWGNNDYYTGNVISADTWYHIAAVYDGGTLSTSTVHIYVNGTAVSLTKSGLNTAAANTTDANYAIGYLNETYPRNWDGFIDEVGIWSRALTPTEITALYNSGNGLTYPFTTTSIKSINGLAYGSVKSYNGLAKASIKNINGLT